MKKSSTWWSSNRSCSSHSPYCHVELNSCFELIMKLHCKAVDWSCTCELWHHARPWPRWRGSLLGGWRVDWWLCNKTTCKINCPGIIFSSLSISWALLVFPPFDSRSPPHIDLISRTITHSEQKIHTTPLSTYHVINSSRGSNQEDKSLRTICIMGDGLMTVLRSLHC